jgi:hypothetical protein
VHQFNAGDGNRSAPKTLQSKHWTQMKFDQSVILLNQVVQEFRGPNVDGLALFVDRSIE